MRYTPPPHIPMPRRLSHERLMFRITLFCLALALIEAMPK